MFGLFDDDKIAITISEAKVSITARFKYGFAAYYISAGLLYGKQ